ncbi:MAG: hypothetical protein LBE44_12345 [Microbacterium hominis]|nr:hypothetical protein [Microbacterium hominis]
MRPPSAGTDCPHQISSPTKAAPSSRGDAAEAHSAVSGDGRERGGLGRLGAVGLRSGHPATLPAR